jgi:hypothetical protein
MRITIRSIMNQLPLDKKVDIEQISFEGNQALFQFTVEDGGQFLQLRVPILGSKLAKVLSYAESKELAMETVAVPPPAQKAAPRVTALKRTPKGEEVKIIPPSGKVNPAVAAFAAYTKSPEPTPAVAKKSHKKKPVAFVPPTAIKD